MPSHAPQRITGAMELGLSPVVLIVRTRGLRVSITSSKSFFSYSSLTFAGEWCFQSGLLLTTVNLLPLSKELYCGSSALLTTEFNLYTSHVTAPPNVLSNRSLNATYVSEFCRKLVPDPAVQCGWNDDALLYISLGTSSSFLHLP